MDRLVRLEGLSFRYSGADKPILKDISLDINKGERVLIRGRSGGGKSTLRSILAKLAPEYILGELTGNRYLDYQSMGVVLQNPEAQIVTPTVEEEVAFALENKGIDPSSIRVKVKEVLELFKLTPLAQRHPLTLSGGECQRVSLAAAFAVVPDILFLDEPTSYLDEQSSCTFFEGLASLSPETAVVVVEHRVSAAAGFCNTAYEVTMEGELIESDFLVPKTSYPKSEYSENASQSPSSQKPILEIRNLTHRYKTQPEPLFEGLNLTIEPGQVAALLGPSGCGKSTLLGKIIRMLPTDDGSILLKGENIHNLKKSILYSCVMYVPQNPEHMFIADTVREELSIINKAVDSAERFGLSEKVDSNVFRLSEGEKRRVNLSAAFASERPLYLLDEPTYGLDSEAKKILSSDIRALTRNGAAVLFVTHEKTFAEKAADTLCVMKKDGFVQEEHHEYAHIQA